MASDRPTEPREGNPTDTKQATSSPAGSATDHDAPGTPAVTTTATPTHSGGISPVATVLLSAILSVACGAGGAYGYLRYTAEKNVQPKPSASATTDRGSGEATSETTSAEAGPSAPSSGDTAEELRTRVDKLAAHLDAVAKQAKENTNTDTSTDLANLQIKVADLSKTTDEFARVTKDFKRIQDQVDTMHGQVRTIRGDLDTIQTRLERSGVRVRTSVSNASKPEAARHEAAKPVADEPVAPEPVLARASDLFKSGKYKEASDLFDSLEMSHPDDARVWYYAALSHGFATGKWTNGTIRLVEKGIERERAGTPKAASIDDTFRDLTTATGKEWLAAYRQRAKTTDRSAAKP